MACFLSQLLAVSRQSSLGDIDFCEITCCHRGDISHNLGHCFSNPRPTSGRKHDYCYFAIRNILLVLQVSISGYEYLIPACFCSVEQLAVAELRPAEFMGSLNTMVL